MSQVFVDGMFVGYSDEAAVNEFGYEAGVTWGQAEKLGLIEVTPLGPRVARVGGQVLDLVLSQVTPLGPRVARVEKRQVELSGRFLLDALRRDELWLRVARNGDVEYATFPGVNDWGAWYARLPRIGDKDETVVSSESPLLAAIVEAELSDPVDERALVEQWVEALNTPDAWGRFVADGETPQPHFNFAIQW